MTKRIYRIQLAFDEREIDVPSGADEGEIARLLYKALDPTIDLDFYEIAEEDAERRVDNG